MTIIETLEKLEHDRRSCAKNEEDIRDSYRASDVQRVGHNRQIEALTADAEALAAGKQAILERDAIRLKLAQFRYWLDHRRSYHRQVSGFTAPNINVDEHRTLADYLDNVRTKLDAFLPEEKTP